MKVNIVTGTKITKIKRTIGAIKKMNPKGLILTPAVKILRDWNIGQDIKFDYYRISKWK
jgi:hypothetical protein